MDPYTAIIMLVASFVISAIFTPPAQTPQGRSPEALTDIDFPQAKEGTPQCVFFGECWSPDWTVLAVGNYRTTPIVKSGQGGKK